MEDKLVFPYLIEANGVPWGDTPEDWIVFVEQMEGYSNIVNPGVITTYLKESGLRILGVVIDANDDFEGRWKSLREQCITDFPNTPDEIPTTGLVVENANGKRFGAWIMPDNQNRGMLENFLAFLRPTESDQLWQFAVTSTANAVHNGSSYKAVHLAKAQIHAWLSWCDPPGQQLYLALIEKLLTPTSPAAQPFVKWFRDLYQV